MKCRCAIAYYITGNEIGKLIIDTSNKSVEYVLEIGYKNENRFPNGQLLKIELVPNAN